MHSPLHIKTMLAYHVSDNPEEDMGTAKWNSDAGMEAREWLIHNELVDECGISERGTVWITAILNVQLPIAKWEFPTEKEV